MKPTWSNATVPIVSVKDLPAQPPRSRIKVLHVITRFWAGAGGNTLVSALGMDPDLYEIWIAGCPGGPLWERAEVAGVRTVRLRRFREVLSPLRDLSVLFQLVRLIRRERFTIVHTHSSKAGVLGRVAAGLCRTPVVVHTFHGFSFHSYMSSTRRRAYLFMERFVRPMTDHVFAVAPAIAREAVERRLARPGAISVVPSAVELDVIPHDRDRSVRDELRIPPEAPLIGTVGRLDFQKAPLDFVRMASIVAAARPSARFVMVGEGSLSDAVREEARRLGVVVTLTGFREDAARIASGFDVFVICSLYEGLGRSLTEALASARPVVASAVNGVPDLVEPGRTGLLVPPTDPEALARSVIWLLDHPEEARRMGEQGRAEVRSQFEPGIMCALLDDAYRSLLGLPVPAPETVPPELGVVGRILPDTATTSSAAGGSESSILSRASDRHA